MRVPKKWRGLLAEHYTEGYKNGHACGKEQGFKEGREHARKEFLTTRDENILKMRGQTIDAMAHALKAMADVMEPQRI